LPVDNADGGCEDEPRCLVASPWQPQIAAFENPPLTSDQIIGGRPFRFSADAKPPRVFGQAF